MGGGQYIFGLGVSQTRVGVIIYPSETRAGILQGPIFRTFFLRKFWGKFRGNFPPKNVGENWNILWKKFWKIVSPRNSEENSAESDFPRKKMYEKSTPGQFCAQYLIFTAKHGNLEEHWNFTHRNLSTRKRMLKKRLIFFSAYLKPILCNKERFCWVL
jgi:hypothetical protein